MCISVCVCVYLKRDMSVQCNKLLWTSYVTCTSHRFVNSVLIKLNLIWLNKNFNSFKHWRFHCVASVRTGCQSYCAHQKYVYRLLLVSGYISPGACQWCPVLCTQTSGNPSLFSSKDPSPSNDSRKLQSPAQGFKVEHSKPFPNPVWRPLRNVPMYSQPFGLAILFIWSDMYVQPLITGCIS